MTNLMSSMESTVRQNSFIDWLKKNERFGANIIVSVNISKKLSMIINSVKYHHKEFASLM